MIQVISRTVSKTSGFWQEDSTYGTTAGSIYCVNEWNIPFPTPFYEVPIYVGSPYEKINTVWVIQNHRSPGAITKNYYALQYQSCISTGGDYGIYIIAVGRWRL